MLLLFNGHVIAYAKRGSSDWFKTAMLLRKNLILENDRVTIRKYRSSQKSRSHSGYFLTHKILEHCSGRTMDALDFQKLIEHTLKNDTRYTCFHPACTRRPTTILHPESCHSHFSLVPWRVAYVT